VAPTLNDSDPELDSVNVELCRNPSTAIVSVPPNRVISTVLSAGNVMLNDASFSPVTVKGAAENEEELSTDAPPVVVRPPSGDNVTVPSVEDLEIVPKSIGVEPVFSIEIGAIIVASIPILETVDET